MQDNITITKHSWFTEIAGFILFVVLLVLKLTNVIDWSWFWVTFPLWIPWAIDLVLVIVIAILLLILGKMS